MIEVEVRIDNRIRFSAEGLSREVVAALKAVHEHDNPHRIAMQKMGIPVWKEPRVLRTWVEDARVRELSFPRGCLARIHPILTAAGIDVCVRDLREEGVPVDLPETRRQLYPFQQRIADAAIAEEQCLVQAGTGAGKTSAFIALASRVGLPTLVVVPNKTLLAQWQTRVIEELGIREGQVGIVKGGKGKLRPITIGTQMSVSKLASKDRVFREYFGCLLFDEVHGSSSATAYAAVDAMPAKFRIGCSAHLVRKDRKHPIINDLFGDAAIVITREELIASGHVLDVEVRAVPTEFEAPWYGMPPEGEEQTFDDEEAKHVDFVRLVREMSDDAYRNAQIIRIVREEAAQGAQVIVLAHLVEHVMRLGQALSGMGTRTGYLLGGDDARGEFQRTADGLRAGTVQVGVGTYKACGVGLDLPQVSVGVAATPIAGNQQLFGQVRGRLCRTSHGKTGARFYVISDTRVFGLRHVANMQAWNAKVVVRTGAGWEPARQWLRAQRAQARSA